MHDQSNGAHRGAQIPPTVAEDLLDQAAVLFLVLGKTPDYPTLAELSREINQGAEGFKGADRMDRAVRDLIGAGLLDATSGTVRPTAAAVRFFQILNGGA
jgi:hypothetical protein